MERTGIERMGKNNKGFTLAEVLVVIAIISIAAGMFTAGIFLIGSRDAEKCAKLINSAMETARMNSLSREGDFTLSVDGDTHMLTITSPADGTVEETLLPGKVSVKIQAEGGTPVSGTELRMKFAKSDGSVKELSIDGIAMGKGSYHTVRVKTEAQGGKRQASVMLVRLTGKHYVEYR